MNSVRSMEKIVDLELANEFVSNQGSKSSVRQLFIVLDDGDFQGIGAALLIGDNLVESRRLALELAELDLEAKRAGLYVYELLRIAHPIEMASGISIGAADEVDLLLKMKELKHLPVLKIKFHDRLDPKVLSYVRRDFSGRLWIDSNNGWNFAEAIRAGEHLSSADVELIEQPVIGSGQAEIAEFKAKFPMTVIADEDFKGLEDLSRLKRSVDGINLKYLKCGGFLKTLELAKVARHEGLKVMLGCKTESTVGVSAMAQLSGLADYLDLDGHLDIVNDPFSGIEICKVHSRVRLSQEYGFGLLLKSDR